MPRNQQQAAPKSQPKPVTKAGKKKNGHDASKARKRAAPVIIRKELDAGPIAEVSGVAEMKSNKGEPHIELKVQEVEAVAMVSKEKLAILNFMREKVKVHIHETSDPQADPRFVVAVNGRKQLFARGNEYIVPRYVVEGLARAKPIGYQNQEFVREDGVRDVRWPAKRGLRYPFSVLEDPSGSKGADWLRNVLRQP